MLKLVTLLFSGLPAIVAAILSFITRKLGTATGTVAAFVVMTAAFIACINVILQNVLALISIPPFLANSLGLFIPADFTAVIAFVVSSRICRVAYDMAVWKIKAVNDAS